MARIFISYRREGTAGFAGRLGEDLERRFGTNEVFRDVEDIASGEDFVERLDHALRDCRVLLAVVDKTWISAASGNRRRLDDPNDFVRTEIARALQSGVRVIPVLVDGASMPAERDLPDDLKAFARRQAHEISDSRWDYDLERLAAAMQGALSGEPTPPAPLAGRARRRWLAAVAAVAGMAAIGTTAWLYYPRIPDLDGTWNLPDGGYWVIRQAGRNLEIDVVHYESREVWKRGRGAIVGSKVEFDLNAVYQAGYTFKGQLSINEDADRLAGVEVTSPSGNRNDLVLQRRAPDRSPERH